MLFFNEVVCFYWLYFVYNVTNKKVQQKNCLRYIMHFRFRNGFRILEKIVITSLRRSNFNANILTVFSLLLLS